MDGKIVIAFVSGALIASGIVYVAVKPAPLPKHAAVAAVSPPPAAPAPAVSVAAPAPPVSPAAIAPAREKPSPMPLPKRRENAVVVARNETPATQPSAVEPKAAGPPAAAAPPPSQETKPANPVPAEPTQPPAPAAPQTAETPAPPPPALPPLEAPPPAEPRVPHTVTITAGTALPVRIGETISSARNQSGDSFLATLEQPLVVEGFIIAERGARIEGRVTDAEPAGRARGVSHLSVALVRLATADGQNIRIRTEPYKKEGADSTGSDVAKIGAGAAIGAAIGAIAGGGKGAAIGAGVGGAAGAGGVLLTHGKPVEIPVESRLSFRIQDPVTITEHLD